MHPELTRQLSDRPVRSDRRQRPPRHEPRIMFLPCPLHILLPRYPRVLGAGLHLSQLVHFRGPPQAKGNRVADYAGGVDPWRRSLSIVAMVECSRRAELSASPKKPSRRCTCSASKTELSVSLAMSCAHHTLAAKSHA